MDKPKILVVDDDAGISSLMRVILTRGGYLVREENRPFAALVTAREFRPDLVLLDVDMPGKDGGMIAAELGGDPILAGTPIIFVTSLVAQHESGIRGGARFLAKPVDSVVLLAIVRQVLLRLVA